MENPDRVKRFLQRVDESLITLNENAKDKKVLRPLNTFLSQEQIDAHFDDHYLGYLKGLKEAEKRLASGDNPRQAMLDIAFNYNGALLHEIYFESLGSKEMPVDLKGTFNKSFGSKSKLIKQLRDALMNARSGWAYIGYDKRNLQFRVGMIDLHESHVALWQPVLALDVWEHAYYIDYSSDKKKYVDELVNNINWDVVARRVDEVMGINYDVRES